jgi:hypothetical protein
MFELADEFAGFMLLLVVFVTGEATATGLLTGDAGGATLAGLLALALLALSPQAMPRAPKARTVESKITFFICLQTPNFSQRFICYY